MRMSEIVNILGHDIDLVNLRVIGCGGFGEVYKCEVDSREFAVKKLLDSTNNGLYDNLEQEVAILRALKHPHIVKLIDIIDNGKPFCLVLEFCPNGNCFEFFQNTGDNEELLPLKFRVTKQVCLGMKYLHSKNILHLDLKAQNVLLDKSFNAKICDFGMSKIKQTWESLLPSSSNTNCGGTITHIAPEKFEDSVAKDTKAMDVYSYGVLLLEIVMGETPFKGWQETAILETIRTHGHPPIKKENIETFFSNIMDCAWQKPDVRPTFEDILKMFKEGNEKWNKEDEKINCTAENHMHMVIQTRRNNFNNLPLYGSDTDNDMLTLPGHGNHNDDITNKKQLFDKKVDNSKQNSVDIDISGFSTTIANQRIAEGAMPVKPLSTIKDENETNETESIRVCISSDSMSVPNDAKLITSSNYRTDEAPLIAQDDNQNSPETSTSRSTSATQHSKKSNKYKLIRLIGILTIISTVAVLIVLFAMGIIGFASCSKLSSPANNGTLECSKSFFIGSNCKFTCLEGYVLQSPQGSTTDNTATCERNKKWSEPTPYCEKEILCPPLTTSAVSNCLINDKVTNGSVCTFSCHTGYVIVGNEVLSCSQQGNWNGTAPQCQKGCPEPKHDDHMKMTCTKTPPSLLDSKCNFSCVENFTFVGSLNIACHNGKSVPQWSDPIPKCYCPSCRTGPNCEHNIEWTEAVDNLNKTSCDVKNVFYFGGYPIACGQVSSKTNCRCTNKNNNVMQDCVMKSEESLFDVCQRALSSLILKLVAQDPVSYKLPCDAWKMPPDCKYFDKKKIKSKSQEL